VIALGFVIARFGLFLQIVSAQSHAARVPSDIPALLGVVLVGGGAAMILAATLQHRRFIATLPAQDRPRNYSGGGLIFVSSLLVTLIGIVLAVYLALSTARP
jgi:putative membrane protein